MIRGYERRRRMRITEEEDKRRRIREKEDKRGGRGR